MCVWLFISDAELSHRSMTLFLPRRYKIDAAETRARVELAAAKEYSWHPSTQTGGARVVAPFESVESEVSDQSVRADG